MNRLFWARNATELSGRQGKRGEDGSQYHDLQEPTEFDLINS